MKSDETRAKMSLAHKTEECFKKQMMKPYYEDIRFDSSLELYFYIYLKKIKQVDFDYHPETDLTYQDENNVTHKYNPDFRIGKTLYECKSVNFLKEKKNVFDGEDIASKLIYMDSIGVKVVTENSPSIKKAQEWIRDTYHCDHKKFIQTVRR